MNYRITNGAISFGAETILEEINIQINEKEKIAIIGRNGSGKTTLLKAIVNNEMLEQGIGEEKFHIYKEGSPIIGYLKQIDFENEDDTLLEEILKVYEPIIALEKKIKKLEEELKENAEESIIKEYTKAMENYERLDGYTYHKEYKTALHKFGFKEEQYQKKMSEFSGGQRTKIAFIKLLLSKPDILLLDEPTNHLDIDTIEWLEEYLKNYPKAVVIVSHDRMFLDKIVNKVYEIEYGTISEYSGNYTFYEKEKRIRYERQLQDYEFQQKEIKRLKDIADRFRYKPTKAKMALSKLKQVERMVKIERPNPYDIKTFHANFEIKKKSGEKVLTAKELKIGYDSILSTISFELYKGQKMGIIGANGMGKSTLLKTLTNRIGKLGGEIQYGYQVEWEYFDQQMAFPEKERTVLEEFTDCFPELTTTQIRNALASFLFDEEEVEKKISMLSGGQRVRLKLCEILKRGPNLLLLDEPTNHMDMIGKQTLENALKQYEGTLLLVSHDRYLISKIADCLLVFENNTVTYYPYNYEEYLERRKEEKIGTEKKEEKTLKEEKGKSNKYLEGKEKNRINAKIKTLEKEIEQIEQNLKVMEIELTKPEIYTDYIKLAELQEKIQKEKEQLEEKMSEWETFSEKLER